MKFSKAVLLVLHEICSDWNADFIMTRKMSRNKQNWKKNTSFKCLEMWPKKFRPVATWTPIIKGEEDPSNGKILEGGSP